MVDAMTPRPHDSVFKVIDTDYRGKPWVEVKHLWALETWRWHLYQNRDHCLMMSDDLFIMPGFWNVLEQMVAQVAYSPIGCMSNHPKAAKLLSEGVHWYRTRAWLVGPCIIMPRTLLAEFVAWYEDWYPALPKGQDAEGYQEWYHDDSSINEWLGKTERYAYHPVPAPIEHRLELGRTHDLNPFPEDAREAVSWRRNAFGDVSGAMHSVEWWRTDAPFLHVTSEERRLGIE